MKKFYHIIFIIFISFMALSLKCWSQEVPCQNALLYALNSSQEIFGPLECIYTQLFEDLNGMPQVYAFIFVKSSSLNDISDITRLKDGLKSCDASLDEDNLVTVTASANKSHTPVLTMYKGLPPFITNFKKVLLALKGQTASDEWQITRYLYLGPFDFWLEMSSYWTTDTFFVRTSDLWILTDNDMYDLWERCFETNNLPQDTQRLRRLRNRWESVENQNQRLIESPGQGIKKTNNNPGEAATLYVNGPSCVYSFADYADEDWFVFNADKGVRYQIFTRPQDNNKIDTIIYLYNQGILADSNNISIAYNDDFWGSLCSLIEWVCPESGSYYICVRSPSPERYGPSETYRIQINSYDLLEQTQKIPDVPDYSQEDFGYPGNCGPVAVASLMGYWDAHGYDLLVDHDPNNIEDVRGLVQELQRAMGYPSISVELGGVADENIVLGILRVCNTREYNNLYHFQAILEYSNNPAIVIDEINKNRPLLYGTSGHLIWGNHWMTTIGYLDTEDVFWVINHDNWSATPREVFVDWDEAYDCTIRVIPNKIIVPPPPPPPTPGIIIPTQPPLPLPFLWILYNQWPLSFFNSNIFSTYRQGIHYPSDIKLANFLQNPTIASNSDFFYQNPYIISNTNEGFFNNQTSTGFYTNYYSPVLSQGTLPGSLILNQQFLNGAYSPNQIPYNLFWNTDYSILIGFFEGQNVFSNQLIPYSAAGTYQSSVFFEPPPNSSSYQTYYEPPPVFSFYQPFFEPQPDNVSYSPFYGYTSPPSTYQTFFEPMPNPILNHPFFAP